MGRMNKFTVLAKPAVALGGNVEASGVGKSDRLRWGIEFGYGDSGLLSLRQGLSTLRPVLPASAITRRAPKCAPDIHVGSSTHVRPVHAKSS
jgi:hypothetical protein